MEEEEVIDISELLMLLWHHALQIIAVGFVAAVVSLLVCTFALTPRYQASVELIVNTRQDTSGRVTNDDINSAKSMVNTYAIVIKSNTVLNMVIDKLGLDMTYDQLNKTIGVTSVNSTQIMQITVENEDPVLAGKIARTISEIAPETVVEKVEAGSCKVVSDVSINSSPVFPQTKKYTLLAALLGCFAACGVILLQHLLHNYIVDDEDIQKNLGLPVLGMIPEIGDGKC